MKDKPEEFEDKAVKNAPATKKPPEDKKPRRKKDEADQEMPVEQTRSGWNGTLVNPVESRATEAGVEIRMKTGRQWVLGAGETRRVLKPGERVRLDEATAETIVNAGYAVYTEG